MSIDIGHLIDAGSYGTVYLARWGGQKCAVKRFSVGSKTERSTAEKEIALLQRLRHRHIIQFYSRHEQENELYLLMDLAEKGSLSMVIDKKELDWPAKARIAHEIARGLEYIHYEGILHRDLKSANVVLTRHLEVKLCDFGLSEIKNNGATAENSESESSAIVPARGSVRWMAPELLCQTPRSSTASDMYALGVVMWEMAANCTKPLREHDNNTMISLLIKDGERDSIPDDTPSNYRQWIERCWDKNPANRPHAAEVALVDRESILVDDEDGKDGRDGGNGENGEDDTISLSSDYKFGTRAHVGSSREKESDIHRTIESPPDMEYDPSTEATRDECEKRLDIVRYREAVTPIMSRRMDQPRAREFEAPFSLGDPVGSGTYAIVYRACWDGTPCAAKTYHRTGPRKTAELKRRLFALQKCRHPHIIEYMKMHQHQGRMYMLMELAEGGCLTDAIQAGQLDWTAKARIAQEIANGLAFLHSKHYLHRTLKSADVLLTKQLQVKLCNFRVAEDRSMSMTRSMSTVSDTVRWMAPELLTIRPKYSEKSDVYALAMVMWEMAANSTTPFHRLESEADVREFVLSGGREVLPADTPSKYRNWAEWCWHQDLAARPDAEKIDLLGEGLQLRPNSDQSLPNHRSSLASDVGKDGDGIQSSAPKKSTSGHDFQASTGSPEAPASQFSVRAKASTHVESVAKVFVGDKDKDVTIKSSKSFTILNHIGSGAYGSVYSALRLDQPCAVKILSLRRDDSRQSTTEEELEILEALHHRHVIQFYGSECRSDQVYLFMERAEHGSLADLISENDSRTLDWPTRYRIALEAARGLAYLHQNEILHRDLRSTNVLLAGDNLEVKLSDIGLPTIRELKLLHSHACSPGTVRWMPPELLSVRPRFSTKSDMYAFGMVLWEMAANCTTPFKEESANEMVMAMVLSGMKEVLPDHTPAEYGDVVRRCWSSRPLERPEATEVNFSSDLSKLKSHGDDDTAYQGVLDSNVIDIDKCTDDFTQFSDNDIFSMDPYTLDNAVDLCHGSTGANVLPENYEQEETETLLHKARDGDNEARMELGARYETGYGVEQCQLMASLYYLEAAEAGNDRAQYRIGEFYFYGQGKERSATQAAEWYRRAAMQGNRDAQHNLGMLYLNGKGVQRSDAMAVYWFRQAAKQDHTSALVRLGWMYRKGRGVEQSDVEAVSWFRKAAGKGDPDALLILQEMSTTTK